MGHISPGLSALTFLTRLNPPVAMLLLAYFSALSEHTHSFTTQHGAPWKRNWKWNFETSTCIMLPILYKHENEEAYRKK
jgi:hypothetical protein